jgi:hypothetical protein
VSADSGNSSSSGESGSSGSSGSSGTSGTSGIGAPSGESGISGGSFTNEPNYLVKTTGVSTLQSVDFLSVSTSGTSGIFTIDGESRIQGVKETYTAVTPASGVVTVDLKTTTVALLTLNDSVTSFTINNLTAGKVNSFTIVTIPNGSVYTITWTFGGVGVKWPGAIAPTLTTTNTKYDVFSFIYDGTNWYGFIGGQNF